MSGLRIVGNVIWFFAGGFLLALGNFIMGIILTSLVITAPIGLGLIQYSKFCLFPFTTSMISKNAMDVKQNAIWQAYSMIVMIFYVIFYGWISFLGGLIVVILNCIFIFTIPNAVVFAKSLGTAFNPVGKICVPISTKDELERRKAAKHADKLLGIK
ncbi:uncharacterized membrane protein YccF (DUF307 family) [Cricetibacter osteomyelitidis]|uniref:Uncharacterized membrane protein YccF (DUF307 family) n=1 Tax=Cricetibacter osteomyelitidis TaxID=1521931 RepID=A0A4R2ST45_9PAST|nr:YccF domain-containing protein [Cricetibacter osteomyelitidis]TCP93519.1 uncharacterized membrane protein YccF (DUF307 family) [Cricetibacter osteomyelitidis]